MRSVSPCSLAISLLCIGGCNLQVVYSKSRVSFPINARRCGALRLSPRRQRLSVEDVLAANEAFYRAFNQKDSAAMSALWSESMDVACVHPGWNVLTGR